MRKPETILRELADRSDSIDIGAVWYQVDDISATRRLIRELRRSLRAHATKKGET